MTVLQILGTLVLGLAVTLVLEGAVMLPVLVRQKRKDVFGAFALVNVATNIALNLILLIAYAADASYCGTGMTFSFCLAALALEVVVVGIEYFVLRKFIGEKYFFWYVLSANALSAVAGSIVLALLMTS
ncbi:MAG TPA: hypothetical protein H9708_03500 [Candidatus Borkfalkia stercoripullorum]|nr:hypothetical protein [Candidatus Borkfalkia stercoripullorum]